MSCVIRGKTSWKICCIQKVTYILSPPTDLGLPLLNICLQSTEGLLPSRFRGPGCNQSVTNIPEHWDLLFHRRSRTQILGWCGEHVSGKDTKAGKSWELFREAQNVHRSSRTCPEWKAWTVYNKSTLTTILNSNFFLGRNGIHLCVCVRFSMFSKSIRNKTFL